MLIRIAHPYPVRPTEITPEALYFDRRQFLRISAAAAGLALAGCSSADSSGDSGLTPSPLPALATVKMTNMAASENVTAYEDVTHYNNYYEFGTGKTDPARNAATLRTRPWSVAVDGECESPGVIDLEDLIRPHSLEERIYRHRCVEAWSLVAPWVGFPLRDLLRRFKPTSRAKYVAFYTLLDESQMPETARGVLDFPYREGLRIDEALHPLAFLSVGLYGRALPNQNGAPLRLTIPWKYGIKSIKSIVRIRFTEQMPVTTWSKLAPTEYGFYSNVNPNVDHPRWSQRRERRLGELFKRQTLMFNGYPEVAPLYAGMDLRVSF
jgi:methionine sulfoxide reductase catalytic subunit